MLFDDASSVEKLPQFKPQPLPASVRADMEDELKRLQQQRYLETLMALTAEEDRLEELAALKSVEEKAAKQKPTYAYLNCH